MREKLQTTIKTSPITVNKVLKAVEELTEQIVSLTAEVVRIRSINPKYPGVDYESEVGGETACNQKLAEVYRQIGCQIDFIEKEPRRANLVGELKGTGGGRSLIFNGHIDVVPVGNPVDWKFGDPFSGREEDGKLYGRGSCDMKGGIVAQCLGVEAIRRCGVKLKGDVILESVVGEETMDHELGVSAVSQKYKADAAVVSEASAPPVPLAVVPVTPGLLWMTLTCEGKATHACMRDELIRAGGKGAEVGVNAIDKGVYLLQALRQLEDQWGQTKNHPLFKPGHFTLHPGVIVGGPHGVLIPFLVSQFCRIEYAIWYPPQEQVENIKQEIVEYIQSSAQLDPWLRDHPPEIDFKLHWPPAVTPVDHPIVQTCAAAHVEVVGASKVDEHSLFQGFAAVCDGAFLNAAGIPSVVYGPGNLYQAHAVNEYVPISELVTAAKTYALIALEWCGGE